MLTSSPIGLPEPQPPKPHPVRRFRAGWALIGLIPLLVVVLLLIVRSTRVQSPLGLAVVGVTPFFALPLIVGLAGSWLSRSNLLRAGAVMVTGAFLYTTSPVDAVIGCRPETVPATLSSQAEGQAGDAVDTTITVYTANTLWDNPHTDEFAAAVAEADPDILVMQEVRWAFRNDIENDPRLDFLAHRSSDTVREDLTTLVWSRWSFDELELVPFQVSDVVRATVDAPAGPVTVYGLHTFAPLFPENVGPWERQLQQLGTIDNSTPHILAGDFNATSDHLQFRQLLANGWTDVHDEKGCGLDNTWPAGQVLPVPVMRLDHVLVSDHFDVAEVRLGHTEGSDHLAVITTVDLQP
jgi:endonuclease/exonuclease/phosphatase family metal-dependent hydrolase